MLGCIGLNNGLGIKLVCCILLNGAVCVRVEPDPAFVPTQVTVTNTLANIKGQTKRIYRGRTV